MYSTPWGVYSSWLITWFNTGTGNAQLGGGTLTCCTSATPAHWVWVGGREPSSGHGHMTCTLLAWHYNNYRPLQSSCNSMSRAEVSVMWPLRNKIEFWLIPNQFLSNRAYLILLKWETFDLYRRKAFAQLASWSYPELDSPASPSSG